MSKELKVAIVGAIAAIISAVITTFGTIYLTENKLNRLDEKAKQIEEKRPLGVLKAKSYELYIDNANRAYLGGSGSGEALLVLKDKNGVDAIRIEVTREGKAIVSGLPS